MGGRAGCWLNCSHTPTNPPYLPVFVGLHTTLTDLLFFKGLLHLLEVCQESYVGTNLREAGARRHPHSQCSGAQAGARLMEEVSALGAATELTVSTGMFW